MNFEDTEMGKTGKPFEYWFFIHRRFCTLSQRQQKVLRRKLLLQQSFKEISKETEISEIDLKLLYETAIDKFSNPVEEI